MVTEAPFPPPPPPPSRRPPVKNTAAAFPDYRVRPTLLPESCFHPPEAGYFRYLNSPASLSDMPPCCYPDADRWASRSPGLWKPDLRLPRRPACGGRFQSPAAALYRETGCPEAHMSMTFSRWILLEYSHIHDGHIAVDQSILLPSVETSLLFQVVPEERGHAR